MSTHNIHFLDKMRNFPGNLGVILVRVCEPVFGNLPHSYTWPLKTRTHSYTRSPEMLIHSYTARWVFVTIYFWSLKQIMQSIHWIPGEQAASKISEWKICAYTWMSEKVGPFIYQSRTIGSVIYILSKKGGQSYTWQRWKKWPFGTHIRTMPYIGSYPPYPPPES